MSDRKPEYLQLEANEDVPSVRDRLSFIRGQRVLLIWPEEGTALTRKLDLVLIQREARRRVIQLALVTHDEQVIQHANDLGISTFETIGGSERARWKRGRTRVFVQRHHKPANTPEPDDLMEAASRVRRKTPRFVVIRRFIERLAALLLIIGTIGGVAYVVLPSASITIELAQREVTVNVVITADPNAQDVDIENAVVPATVLRATVESTGTIPTTGVESIGDTTAAGTVVFTNLTDEPVTIPANTTLSTSAGTPVLFRTLDEITVSTDDENLAEVRVEAMQASTGGIGNVEAGLINTVIGPLENQVSVRNLSATTGGESRTIPIVAVEDMDRLIAIVRGQLQSAAYQEMQANLSETQFIIIESIDITEERNDWTTFSHDIGDATDSITLSMRAVVEAVTVDDRFGRQVALARLSAAKPPALVIQPETFVYERGGMISLDAAGRVTFNATSSGWTTAQINPSRLQDVLAGQPIENALQIITGETIIAEGTAPIIEIMPENRTHFPLLPLRIDVNVIESIPGGIS